ncbi:hypothetical protein Q5P01_008071 [Channa striata]|uniref:Uncharacterized protein n=1 Tax=Channa striata TaxID=64152 RepID=A0AA88N5A9_CHASR|nr:hypothetical protein Q5P01_008071 [Channa striata]
MDLSPATFAALCLLLASASGAPAGSSRPDGCADVQKSSLELNHVAKLVSVQARNGSQRVIDFSTSLAWMEAKDMCDPGTLKQDSASCIGKILDVLKSYSAAIERIAEFPVCSNYATKVKPVMLKLQRDMNACVKSRGGTHRQEASQLSNEVPQSIYRWQEPLLCHYTLDRLFSFSIFTARVFAVGDPAGHTEGSAQRCTSSLFTDK